MSDESYLKFVYKIMVGKILNLDNPTTFTEKLQWLKLHKRNEQYTLMVDKASVKKLVAEKIGDKYIIPTLGVYNRFENVDFNVLPDSFVIKSTHDSGGVVICKNKSEFDIDNAKKIINRSLKHNFFDIGREYPYKNVVPRVIAEEYISALGNSELGEYKFFCFNGEPKIVLVCKGKAHSDVRTNDYMDINFERIPVQSMNPISEEPPKKPEQYDEMISIARKLSEGIIQVRVDLYLAGDKIYFGELTFFHNSGLCNFEPKSYDEIFGAYIEL